MVGCSKEQETSVDNLIEVEVDLIIGFEAYPSSLAQSYLLKNILENKGYIVSLKNITGQNKYEAIEQKKIDVAFGCWLPDINMADLIQYEDSVETLGINYASSEIRLYAPFYSHISDITELNFYRRNLDRTIYVLESNNDYLYDMINTWLETNEIDYTIQTLSANELDQKIKEYAEENKWLVFAGWSPHYLLGKYNLRPLTGKTFIFPQQNHTIINRNYNNEEIRKVIKDFYLEPWEMNELLLILTENEVRKYNSEIEKWIRRSPNLQNRIR